MTAVARRELRAGGRGGARMRRELWAPVMMGQPLQERRAAPRLGTVCVRSDGRPPPLCLCPSRGGREHWRLSNASTTRCLAAKLANDNSYQSARAILGGLGTDGSCNDTARKFCAGSGPRRSNKLALPKRIRPPGTDAHAATAHPLATRPPRSIAARRVGCLGRLPAHTRWAPSAAKWRPRAKVEKK